MNTTLQSLLPLYAPSNEGTWLDLGDHRGRAIISSQQSGGAFLLVEVEVDFLGGVPPHIHEREEETFIVLEGCIEVIVDGTTYRLQAGDTSFAPRDIAHTWRCVSEGGGRFLLLVTPGENFEQFALKMGEAQIVPSDAALVAQMCALALEHGITMLPPQ